MYNEYIQYKYKFLAFVYFVIVPITIVKYDNT